MVDEVNNTPANEAEDTFGKNIDKQLDIAIEAQDGPTETKSEEKPTVEGAATEQPAKPEDSNGSDSDSNAQQQPKPEAKEEPKQTHGAKDLKLADGTVVKGGAERRFYEQREVARQRAATLEADLTAERKRVDEVQQKYTQLEQTVQGLHGADPTQVKIGLNIVRDLQRDPAGTMQKLLAEVVAQGYTVEGIASGVDQAAITRMIDERLPKTNTATEKSDEELTREATEEAHSFFRNFPDAVPHDALLARVLRDNPGMDLRTAYFQTKEAFAERGFDWSLPLDKNLEQSSLATEQPKTSTVPLPNGGNLNGSDVRVNRENLAHESEDTGDIVRAAMREAGMKI